MRHAIKMQSKTYIYKTQRIKLKQTSQLKKSLKHFGEYNQRIRVKND